MPARPLTPALAEVATGLQRALGLGAAAAEDLVRLGVRSREDLARRDPSEMYETLSALDGARHDPRVKDVFTAAVERALQLAPRRAADAKARDADLPPRVRARVVRDAPRDPPPRTPPATPAPRGPAAPAAPRPAERAPRARPPAFRGGERAEVPDANRWRAAREARRG